MNYDCVLLHRDRKTCRQKEQKEVTRWKGSPSPASCEIWILRHVLTISRVGGTEASQSLMIRRSNCVLSRAPGGIIKDSLIADGRRWRRRRQFALSLQATRYKIIASIQTLVWVTKKQRTVYSKGLWSTQEAETNDYAQQMHAMYITQHLCHQHSSSYVLTAEITIILFFHFYSL